MGLMQDPPQPTTIPSKMKQRKQAFPPLSYPEASGSSQPYSTNPPSAPSDAGSSSSEHPLRPVPLERIPEPNRRFGPRTPRTLHRKIHEAFSGNSSRRTRNTTPPESQNRDAPPLPPTPTAIRQSIDGGVRVAVGPPVRVTSSEPPQRSGTIPPPYSHYTS